MTLTREGAPADWPDPFARYTERLNTERRPIDVGPVVTSGAARLALEEGSVRIYPLPQEVAFSLAIRPDDLGLAGDTFAVEGLDADGNVSPELRRRRRAGCPGAPGR